MLMALCDFTLLKDGQPPHSFGRLPDGTPRLGLGIKLVRMVAETARTDSLGGAGLGCLPCWWGLVVKAARDSVDIPVSPCFCPMSTTLVVWRKQVDSHCVCVISV